MAVLLLPRSPTLCWYSISFYISVQLFRLSEVQSYFHVFEQLPPNAYFFYWNDTCYCTEQSTKKKKKVPLGTEIHSSPWVAEPNPGNKIQKPKWYWNDELKEQNNHGCSRVKIKSYLLFPEGNELINSLTRNISLCFVTMCKISVTNSILSSCAMVEHIVPMISLHYRLKRRKVSVSEAWQVLQG